AVDALPTLGAVRKEGLALAAADVPATDATGTMMRIWCELLGRPSVALDDDFFELGGQSLLATRLAVRIRDEFGVEVPVAAILEAPTVAALVAWVAAAAPATAPASAVAAPAAVREESYPLSFAQQRLWFLDQLEGYSPTYNIPAAVRLKGRLDTAALEGALNDVVLRHDALRARFGSVDGTPVQYIAERVELALALHDLRASAPGEREAQTRQLMLDEASTPFDLHGGPLVRGSLLRLADDEHLLLLTMHHIVSDGWSMGILVRELGTLYASRAFGAPAALPELPMRYVDFARWQREWLSGEVLERQLGYWKKQLAGAPTLLTLPTDRPRPPTQGQDGAALAYALPAELSAKLQALSRKSQGTLFMTLCAAFNVLLARYSGQNDICIGTPIANRNRSEIEDLIGFFVNTLVLRNQVDLSAGFTDLLKQVRATTLDAYAHQDVQFEQLVGAVQPERHTSYSPLFQVMLVLQNAPLNLALPGLELELVPHETVTAKFDLTLTFSEGPQGLYGSFEYNTDLFDRATIERMGEHFANLLQAIVAEPERPLGELPMIGEAEYRQLVYGFNDTAKAYPRVTAETNTLHQLFEAQVARTPEHVAVVYENRSLTYAELNAQANRLARHLRHLGVGPDVLVGLCTERSIEMIVGLYAIEKAGGAYVPLDPTYPSDRLATIVEDAAPAAILTLTHLRHAAPAIPGLPVLCIDGDAASWAMEDAGNPVNATQPGDLAYVIYTSGSTGKPKGVGIDHRGIVNRLEWMQEAYPLTAADRVLQKTPFSFDVSVWEFFWPLLEGATLVVAKPGGHQDVAYLAGLIDAERITTTHFVPPMLEVFLNEVEPGSGRSLRQVMCSGQALPMDLQQRFFATWDHVALHNLYGPTEASVDVTYWQCRKDSALNCVPIGKPIANIQIHILDDYFNPVPVGVVGHLYIAGVGLARGYVNRPDLTGQTFIPNPFSAEDGARMYLSGDLARYLPDGNIEYLGRSDHQVKIRGLRIELGEIESTLAALEAVRDVVVLARPDERGVQRLVAYLVAHDGQALPDPAVLRRTLAQTLPDYMVPEYFVGLATMPLTSNGKVDRKVLPAPEMAQDEGEHVAPRTAMEKAIAAVWSELLKVEKVGLTDDFFELGGHSLLATQLVSQLRKRHVAEIELRDLFSHATLGALASFVDTRKQGGLHPNLVPIRAKGTAAPLFLIHPIGGGVQYAFDLAQHLDANQPVYGLAVGETLHRSIDAMATAYLDAIREVRPSGPYLLAGWSLGGMVAYEIAHRLLAAGEDVQFVGMIDTSAPALRARERERHPVQHDACRALLNWLLDLNLAGDWRTHPDYPELMARAIRGDLDGVIALCMGAGLVPAGLDADEVKRTVALYEACGRAADDYRPPAAQLPVTYFAADRHEGDEVSLGWRDLVGRHLEVSRIGGSHLSIVSAPLNEKLARDISARIGRYTPNLSFTAASP
ncbi:amino acid adenylation domain-containing protein, partial [Dyella sp.]|uniref:amino acid adenylation domain-containing protein n=1 Tax=Dyella sp. TaxID=1869338 RepID=UPI003217D263